MNVEKHYKALGLDPAKPVTPAEITAAYQVKTNEAALLARAGNHVAANAMANAAMDARITLIHPEWIPVDKPASESSQPTLSFHCGSCRSVFESTKLSANHAVCSKCGRAGGHSPARDASRTIF